MKILITGSKGFIGKNLVAELKNRGYDQLLEFDKESDPDLLNLYCKECDFVFHLAGINRPEHPEEFMEGNFDFTSKLLRALKDHANRSPILVTSSIQAELDNPYGKSKKAGEELLFGYGCENNVSVFMYRLPNAFGKWCRPNYNSVVATFCYNITREIPIQVNDPEAEMNLVYIDDIVQSFISRLESVGEASFHREFEQVTPVYKIKLGEIAALLFKFKESRDTLLLPDVKEGFEKKLYSTYLSYLPEDQFGYSLKMNTDARGSFTEFIKSPDRGQVSVNISKPHITKGNHWHHTKNEKFLVVSGKGVIRFRQIGSDKIIEYYVSGEKLEVIDIPVGYTHNIENIGDTDMVTVMWVNEPFDKNNPDTYFLEV